jgi:hypothetical protein
MKLSRLLENVNSISASSDGVHWYPLRPSTAENTFIIPRIKAAWRVLTGKSDAIEWDEEPKEVPQYRGTKIT